MSEKPLILCFIDNRKGRDAEIVLPVGYALEKYHNCRVEYLFIWDIYKIRLKSPDLVLLPNCRGHHMYVEIAAYAKKNDIKVLALESEGNFATDGSFDFWGYNLEKKVYQEWLTCWTKRAYDYLSNILTQPNLSKLILTGGTGFDKYQYLEFADKTTLLRRYNKQNFKKVIGYAGWAFGKLYGQHKHLSFTRIYPDSLEKRHNWVENERVFVRDTLRYLIEANPSVLFILKKHPKEAFESDVTEGLNEMNELIAYENVLYIKKEEAIHDLINISDIWLGYKTTTAIEAWLLNKPTILINRGHKYAVDNLYEGSVKISKASVLQTYVDEYYKTGELADFTGRDLIKARGRLIKDTVGFSDGLNHIRAVKYFSKSLTLRKSTNKPVFNFRHFRLFILMHYGRYLFNKSIFQKLPYFRKTLYVFENRNLPQFEELKANYYKKLSVFHKRTEAAIRKIYDN